MFLPSHLRRNPSRIPQRFPEGEFHLYIHFSNSRFDSFKHNYKVSFSRFPDPMILYKTQSSLIEYVETAILSRVQSIERIPMENADH